MCACAISISNSIFSSSPSKRREQASNWLSLLSIPLSLWPTARPACVPHPAVLPQHSPLPPPPLQQHHRRRTTQNRVRLIDPTKSATPILTTLSTVLSPRRRAAGSPASFPASALPRQDWSRMTIKFGVLVSQNHQSRFERRQSAYPQVFAWSFE